MANFALGSGMITVYTDKVAAGDRIRFTPVIRINPRYKNDVGLHVHEKTHVAQWVAVAILTGVPVLIMTNWFIALCIAIVAHDALYHFIPAYRLKAEIQAYRKQLTYGGSVDLAAKALSSDYGLRLSYDKAVRLLT